MLKKVLISAGLTLGVIAVVSPQIAGLFAEHQIRHYVTRFNQESLDKKLEIDHYQRRWFTAEASIILSSTVANNVPLVTNQVTLYHGPVIIADGGVTIGLAYLKNDMQLNPRVKSLFGTLISKQTVPVTTQVSGKIGLLGGLSLDSLMPAFDLEIDKKVRVQWQGSTGAVFYNNAVDKVKSSGHVKGLRLMDVKDPVVFELNDLSLSLDYQRDPSSLWVGEGDLTLSDWQIKDDGEKKQLFSMSDVRLQSESSISKKLFSANQTLNIGSIHFVSPGTQLNETIGPVAISLSFHDLDADMLSQIKHQAETLSEMESKSDQQLRVLGMMPMFIGLVDKGFSMELEKFNIQTPDGKVGFKGAVGIKKMEQPLTMFNMIQRVNFKLTGEFPASKLKAVMTALLLRDQLSQPHAPDQPELTMAQQTAEAEANADKLIKQYLDRGWLVQSGNQYQLDFSFNDGQFLMNGKPQGQMPAQMPVQTTGPISTP